MFRQCCWRFTASFELYIASYLWMFVHQCLDHHLPRHLNALVSPNRPRISIIPKTDSCGTLYPHSRSPSSASNHSMNSSKR